MFDFEGMRLALAALLLPLVLADVMPHCGPPRVVIREPGEDCGHHGPRWRGDCREPGVCMRLDDRGARCTLTCATDADCSKLGAGFTCSARATPYGAETTTAVPVCARPE